MLKMLRLDGEVWQIEAATIPATFRNRASL